jgi:hypothetical protein
MQRPDLAARAVVLALALTSVAGCTSDSGPGGPSHAGPTLTVVADTPTPAEAPSATARPPKKLRFGKTFTYAAGLRVRIGKPEPFRPSPWVERMPGRPTRFTIIVVNHTGEIWNPSQLHVRLTSGFQPAVQIYDADLRVVARPERRVPDARSVRFAVGYWVPDLRHLTLEFEPGFGYARSVIQR